MQAEIYQYWNISQLPSYKTVAVFVELTCLLIIYLKKKKGVKHM